MHRLLNFAVEKRRSLGVSDTNAMRLIDGDGDHLPGIFLDAFADRWLLSTTASSIPHPLRDWLVAQNRSCYWKRLDQHQKASPIHVSGDPVESPFLIRENGLSFEIAFQSGYSQGIFLDQRDNRSEVRTRMAPGMRLLNTFAYTGAFSVAAAAAGGETTTLDLSQPYLDWARRNFTYNGIAPEAHHFCKGDTFHWLRRFAKQGRRFDGIILDPPTFSRADDGKIFRVEKDFGALAASAAEVLSADGWLLCCTNFRGISAAEFERQLAVAVPHLKRRKHSAMPPDFTGEPYLKSLWLQHH
jgi:23S rRNA (cytosine1962-C5)-methyltransferase